MTETEYVARVWHDGWSWCWSVDKSTDSLPALVYYIAPTERAAIRRARREKAKMHRRDARRREERIV